MVNPKKEQTLQYLLQLISNNDASFVEKTIDAFGISKSTVYNYIKQLLKENLIQQDKEELVGYRLTTREYAYRYKTEQRLEEDRIFEEAIAPLLVDLPQNVRTAWRYAFTEMMNNAIEHSGSKNIACLVIINALNTTISILDNGIGIFKNIQKFILETKGETLTLKECASILLAGKFTTAKENHSGEGIFFTSHLMDDFAISSDNVMFTRDNFTDSQNPFPKQKSGTFVLMRLSNQSKKTLSEIFNRFSDCDDGFFKTHIPIAHMFPSGAPVARSEARRLCNMISQFKEVILDFQNVEEIGQAFAHELFVVWQNLEPHIKLEVVNTNEVVDWMIKRVKNTK